MHESLNENSNWLAVPHEQLWRDINTGPGARASVPIGDFYAKASQAVADAQQNLRNGLTRMTAGWQGAAASEATVAIVRLHEWADTAQQGLEAARAASAQQAQHYSDARSKIPAPSKAAPAPAGSGPGVAVANNVDQDPVEQAHNDAHRKAAEAMAIYQSQSSGTVSSLPVYNSAPDVAILVGGTTFSVAGGTPYGQAVDASSTRHGYQQQAQAASASIPGQQTGPASVGHQFAGTTGLSGAMMSPTTSASHAPTTPGPQTGASFGTAGGGIIGGVLGVGGSTTRKQSGGRGTPSTSAQKSAAPRSSDPGSGIMQSATGRPADEDQEHDSKFVLTGDDVFHLDDMVAPTVIGAEEDDK